MAEEAKESKEVQPTSVPSLDDVNKLTQQQLEGEQVEPTEPKEEPKKEEPVVEEPVAPPEPPVETPAAAQEEVVKPDDTKVAVKGYDGKTYYFDSIEDAPDDFEFSSFKEMVRATQAFVDKTAVDKKAARAEAKKVEDTAKAERLKSMQQGWDSEITKLTEADLLPKDSKERETAVQEIYDYMGKQLEEGVVYDSITPAYKAMNYDKMKASEGEEIKKTNDAKKQRGGMVQAGGTNPPSKPKYVEGPPAGLSLDRVHEKVLANL